MANILIMCLMIVLVIFMICGIMNKYLPVWFCDKLSWHLAPTSQGFDGCSANGTCPRCGKKVLLDSQGNWF